MKGHMRELLAKYPNGRGDFLSDASSNAIGELPDGSGDESRVVSSALDVGTNASEGFLNGKSGEVVWKGKVSGLDGRCSCPWKPESSSCPCSMFLEQVYLER